MGSAADKLDIKATVGVALICAFCKRPATIGHMCIGLATANAMRGIFEIKNDSERLINELNLSGETMTDEQVKKIADEIGWVKDELIKIEHRMMELIYVLLLPAIKDLSEEELEAAKKKANLFYKNSVRV